MWGFCRVLLRLMPPLDTGRIVIFQTMLVTRVLRSRRIYLARIPKFRRLRRSQPAVTALLAIVCLSLIAPRRFSALEPLEEGTIRETDQVLRQKLAAFLSRTITAPVVRVQLIDPPDSSGLRRVVVQLGEAPDSQTSVYYVTADGHEILDGEVRTLVADPWRKERDRLRSIVVRAPTVGSPNAPVLLVEFSDLECPYCAQLSRSIDRLEHEMPAVLRLAFKHFPLEKAHPWAARAARSGVCVAKQDEKSFWIFERLVFEHQKEIDARTAIPQLRDLAVQSGANLVEFDSCISSPRPQQDVDASQAEGRTLGASGVPTIFINGRMISGAISYETLRALVLNEAQLIAQHSDAQSQPAR